MAVQIYSSWVAGDNGIFVGCPQRPQAEPLLLEKKAQAALSVPSPGFSLLAVQKVSERAAFPETACGSGARRPLPEQLTGHICLAPQVPALPS